MSSSPTKDPGGNLLASGITSEIMCFQVLGFLDRESIQQCLDETTLCDHFLLKTFVCTDHLTVMNNQKELRKERMRDYEHKTPHKEPREIECADCVESEFGRRRCEECDGFFEHGTVIECSDCHKTGCMFCYKKLHSNTHDHSFCVECSPPKETCRGCGLVYCGCGCMQGHHCISCNVLLGPLEEAPLFRFVEAPQHRFVFRIPRNEDRPLAVRAGQVHQGGRFVFGLPVGVGQAHQGGGFVFGGAPRDEGAPLPVHAGQAPQGGGFVFGRAPRDEDPPLPVAGQVRQGDGFVFGRAPGNEDPPLVVRVGQAHQEGGFVFGRAPRNEDRPLPVRAGQAHQVGAFVFGGQPMVGRREEGAEDPDGFEIARQAPRNDPEFGTGRCQECDGSFEHGRLVECSNCHKTGCMFCFKRLHSNTHGHSFCAACSPPKATCHGCGVVYCGCGCMQGQGCICCNMPIGMLPARREAPRFEFRAPFRFGPDV
ncbi:expressed unknown protein [Seminavis robusta]|uniref:Uncharacterized protein n=1 Tax=Seminavis robusta TaxID=568900 RepID=A0A9N8EU84_9STRA|nr:expressed unknown protein [Seminavis robusta]|eukprot:Sro1834_g300530.1 n/a (482) ;mRNA; f:10855-12300